jgi:hypothetical protein
MIRSIYFRGLLSFILLSILLGGCKMSRGPDVSGIDMEKPNIKRYEIQLFNLHPDSVAQGLEKLAGDYSIFIGDNYNDTLSVIQILDFITAGINRDLAAGVEEEYPDLGWLEEDLTGLFRHAKYYFPDFQAPEVYTYVSGMAYDEPVFYADSVLIIALDMFLGEDHPLYRQSGLPYYRIRRMTREHLLPEIARAMSVTVTGDVSRGRTLLDFMVYYGKELHYIDLLLPETPGHLKIGYTEQQWQWCIDHEEMLWSFYIQQELLFSNDFQSINKMIQDGPFTTDFGSESAPMTGRWVGWQIVSRYSDKTDDENQRSLFATGDAQKILNESGYKPGR